MRAAMKGFTLIELLVVISILAVLVVAFLPNVLGAATEGERVETHGRMEYLVQAIKAYERKKDYYPADNFRDPESGKSMGKDNGVNSGIESLVLALCQKRLGSDSLADHEDWLGNTDGDRNTVETPLLERRALVEVVDAWGLPFYYACAQTGGYSRSQQVQSPDEMTFKVRAFKNPETGRVAGKGKFQLISAGPDGEFGNQDDLTYPKMR